MSYIVVKHFTDLKDDRRPYYPGDAFPHPESKIKITKSRLAELSSVKNLQKTVLIEEVTEPVVKETDETVVNSETVNDSTHE